MIINDGSKSALIGALTEFKISSTFLQCPYLSLEQEYLKFRGIHPWISLHWGHIFIIEWRVCHLICHLFS